MNRRLLNGTILVAVILLLLFFGVSCGLPGDPIADDLYTQNIYPGAHNTYDIGTALLAYRNGYFANLFIGGAPVVPGAEVDPIFTASPAFGITAGNIVTWDGHPALTTGTHGVAGTIVGTSDAQSLTNKNLTMNNNVPIYWKDTLGADVEVFNLFNWLDILAGGTKDAIWWLSSGTGRTMYLWGSSATAINTTKDAPIISLLATYWNAGSHNWEAKIVHGMVTGGAAPKSRLGFLLNDIAVLRLENDNGTVKTYSDGALDMTTHQINNVVDPTLAQDAATRNYVDSMGKTASGSLTAGNANAIAFAWHNPESQDILVKKVVIEVTTGGGTVGSHLDVGIADDAVGTNRGTEQFTGLLLNNVLINDSWKAADGGNQTKWVLCQDIVSATDGWVVGQILDANATNLVGKYYIEYIGR